MIKAIVLDCGGVIVYPINHDWLLGPGYEEILGDDFLETKLDTFRTVRRDYLHLLPDTHRMLEDDAEYHMFIQYYDAVLGAMGISLPPDALAQLASIQTYRDDRYGLFDDVLPMLRAWRATYRIGIVSDAPPSTRRIMDSVGVTALLDGATYSSELGILKPNPDIYRATLAKLDVLPEDAVFVDDMPGNLVGAEAIGMRGIQMRRPMPALFQDVPQWEGPVVHSFAELDALVRSY